MNQYCVKLTLKSNRASIWFWMIGMVLRSFSVFMVLITPSTLKENIMTLFQWFVLRIRSCWTSSKVICRLLMFSINLKCIQLLSSQKSVRRSSKVLPTLYFCKIESHLPIWHCFFVQISAVPPNKRWHVITYETRNKESINKLSVLSIVKGIPSLYTWPNNLNQLARYMYIENKQFTQYLVVHFCPKSYWGWITYSWRPDTEQNAVNNII